MVYCFVAPKKRDPVQQQPGPEERIRYRIEHPKTEDEREMFVEMSLNDDLRPRMEHLGFRWIATHIGWAYSGAPFVWSALRE